MNEGRGHREFVVFLMPLFMHEAAFQPNATFPLSLWSRVRGVGADHRLSSLTDMWGLLS